MRIKLPCFTVSHGSCPGSPRLGFFLEASICTSSNCITCSSTSSHVPLDFWVDEGEIHQQPGGIGIFARPDSFTDLFGERFGTLTNVRNVGTSQDMIKKQTIKTAMQVTKHLRLEMLHPWCASSFTQASAERSC